MLLLIESSVCYPVILYAQHKANPFVLFLLTSLDLPVYCNKLSHYNSNSITWGWRDNCHRHDSWVSGISLENGMLRVASGMGAFPTSSPPCSPHWGTYLVRNLFWRALLEDRHFLGDACKACIAWVGVWRAVELESPWAEYKGMCATGKTKNWNNKRCPQWVNRGEISLQR